MLLAATMAVFNQLTGINAILYYAPSILMRAGDDATAALLKTVATGVILLLFTVVAMFVIDRFGRRILMLIGSIGMSCCLAIVGWEFSLSGTGGSRPLLLPALLGHIAFFACSQGCVIWVFISEIFPNAVRAKGQAFGWTTHWMMAAAVTWTFPGEIDHLGSANIFGFFAAVMAVQFLFAWLIMPETKGRALEEIGQGQSTTDAT